jgi:type II secretory pathway pseudopilin PulG
MDQMNPSAIQTPTRCRKKIAIAGIAVLIIVVILSTYLIAALNRARETANRVKCNKQMRALGQAMFLYANENRGAWPPALKDLILTQDVTPGISSARPATTRESPATTMYKLPPTCRAAAIYRTSTLAKG